MPSFQDSAFIFFLALLLFGPKKLPELARYVGKLMAEFRRASYEFRSQMEEEFRVAEQAEQQKKIAAIEAAAPVPPVQPASQPEQSSLAPVIEPSTATAVPDVASDSPQEIASTAGPEPAAHPAPEPIPIASSGDLHLMPPATGLPVARGSSSNTRPPAPDTPDRSLSGLFDSIPHTPEPAEPETTTHA